LLLFIVVYQILRGQNNL